MSDFDNFDIHQISSKLAQRWLFVCSFCCKKSFVLGSFDNAENAKRQFFLGHPIYTLRILDRGYGSQAIDGGRGDKGKSHYYHHL